MRYSLEMKMQIWDDNSGEVIEIGEDADALGLLEIKQKDQNGKILARISMDESAAPLAIKAIETWMKWKKEQSESQEDVDGKRPVNEV